MEGTIRRFRPSDHERVLRIGVAAFARDPATELHVREEGGAIVGCATATLDAHEKMGELGLDAVDPAYQGRGLGRQLAASLHESRKL